MGRRALIVAGVVLPSLAVVGEPAFAASHHKKSACNVTNVTFQPVSPVSSDVVPPGDVLAELALLRRAPTAADQLPQINDLAVGLIGELATYNPAYTRAVAMLADGRRLYLVAGTRGLPALPPLACLPARTRKAFQRQEMKRRGEFSGPAFCLAAMGRATVEPPHCATFAQLAQGRDLFDLSAATLGVSAQFKPRLVGGLAPDAVADVRVLYRGGRMATAAVNGDFFSFRPPDFPISRLVQGYTRLIRRTLHSKAPPKLSPRTAKHLAGLERRIVSLTAPLRLAWLDAAGHVIKQFKLPPGGLAQGSGGYASLTNSVSIDG